LFELVNGKQTPVKRSTERLNPRPRKPIRTRAPKPVERLRRDAPGLKPGEVPFEFRNGRLRVNLGWTGLSSAAVGLVLLLLISFQAGGRFHAITPSTIDGEAELNRILAGPADPSVLELPASERRASPRRIATAEDNATAEDDADSASDAPGTSGATLTPGRHYVIVQYFPNSRQRDAEKAAAFLSESGVPAAVFTSGPDIRLIALEGFWIDQPDGRAGALEQKRCDALKSRIRELGKEYARQGGGYALDAPRERKQR
jgi:hypothetical protein